MSYMSAPRLHQSTARLCPLLIRISGALKKKKRQRRRRVKPEAWMCWCVCKSSDCLPYMYSIVPQKVWVTVPSWMDSLHRPKSVSFTCPRRWMRTEDTLEGSRLCFNSWMQNKQKIFARKSQLVKDMYLGRTFSKQLLVFQYRCYWAWCFQVLSPCRWCLFGAGDPAPLRSRPGRNCQQKNTTQVPYLVECIDISIHFSSLLFYVYARFLPTLWCNVYTPVPFCTPCLFHYSRNTTNPYLFSTLVHGVSIYRLCL